MTLHFINELRISQLEEERNALKQNFKAWKKLHSNSEITPDIARTFKAYQTLINRCNTAIRNLKNGRYYNDK